MGFLERFSLGTHLLIAAGLMVGVLGGVVASNWTTFATMYDNLTAMNEGAQVAEGMRQPDDLLDYLAARPEQGSLVAYEVGAREEGIFFGSDRERPVVKTAHLLLLTEYARLVEAGVLDRDERVPLDSLALYALPGVGQGHHERVRADWREENVIQSDRTVALRHVVDAIFQAGDDAAGDWLMMRLGRERVEALPGRWGLRVSDPPRPSSGLYLSWSLQKGAGVDSLRGRDRGIRSSEADADRVYRLTHRMRRDTSFRQRVRKRLEQRGTGLSVRDQRRLAGRTYPTGTAREYADLLARLVTGDLGSAAVEETMQAHLETPIDSDTTQAPIASIATHVAAMPGLISFVGYARPIGDEPPRVSVLFLEDLPIGLFYHLVQTGLDKGFQLRLLSDADFFQRVRTTLGRSDTLAAREPGSSPS